MLRKIIRIAGKELIGFFASPAAVLFLAAFVGVTLFVFFWAAAFFERNLADVRPLFQWMPVLLIFLVAALTMRSWAEERRSGTLELLLTSPTTPTEHVLGKFAGVWLLVLIALALTLPLPISVSFLGPLDWGPVIGGYAAAICLAAAYVSIGLWISSRTDNQIVSLILTVVIAGAFYLIGSDTLTNLVGYRAGEWLRDLGAGSRFVSITRGVLDLRDIYYYFSITATFLVLNRLSLERLRWAGNSGRAVHRGWYAAAALLAANLLGANLWLGQIASARIDLTSGRLYTLSDATRSYLTQLQEPLLIRGYFSAATHPLLTPLVPQLRDLLQEYAVAGGRNVRVEFVDPHDDPKVEAEATDRYDIHPVPFEVAGKYRASVVNSYFDILVSYGDQFQVLTFRDLIDVKARDETNINVELKDPEYAITSAIRKVLLSYQNGGNPFDALQRPLTFTGYISASANLPQQLQSARIALDGALGELQKQANGKLHVGFQDPSADKSLSNQLSHDFGFRPMALSTDDARPFWFYMTLSDGHQTEQISLPANFDQAHLKSAIADVVTRFSPGLLKTVAVVSPPAAAISEGLGGESFSTLRQSLSGSVRWLDADLKDGRVPAEADMLMVLEPMGFDPKQVFAVDQFLMQGGTVVVATAPQDVVPSGDNITARPIRSGLSDWLAQYGLSEERSLVLDRQSGALPIPVRRNVGGAEIEELELASYPYIVDVRGAGLADNPITRDLEQLDMPWVAPIDVDARHGAERKTTILLRSSPQSWLSSSPNLTDFDVAPTGTVSSHPLAVMLEGQFDSAFKGRLSPLLPGAADASGGASPAPGTSAAPDASAGTPITSVIDHSPSSARLILVGSSTMFSDQVLGLLGQSLGRTYDKPVQFIQNIIDWSLADQGLMGIRGREQFARTLTPLSNRAEQFWEYLNYGVVLGALALVWAFNRHRRRRRIAQHLKLLQEG